MDEPEDDPQRYGVGGNMPPASTTYDDLSERIDGLYTESAQWLDGAPIDTPELADGVVSLLTALRDAGAAAEAMREAEKRPHLNAGRAVDATWKPLIAKAEMAMITCKTALQPWLDKLALERDQQAREAQARAEAAIAKAREMIRDADRANLKEVTAAEAMLAEAKHLAAKAGAADKASVSIGSSDSRVTLRIGYVAVMVDASAALTHYKRARPEALKGFLQSLAEADVRAGKREIPGFQIVGTRSAVTRSGKKEQ
jgi:hypothetical protein